MNYSLNTLKTQMIECQSCDLCHERKQVVLGTGSDNPDVMIIGEAPNAVEDQLGQPFVGPIGEKLDKMLSYAGISRDKIYITNAVLCRPPNDRPPRQEELEACHWRLELEIKILKPKLIILLGKVAVQQLSGKPVKGALSKLFLNDFMKYQLGEHESNVIVTYHPNYHLHAPEKAYKITLPHWTKIKEWIAYEQNRVDAVSRKS